MTTDRAGTPERLPDFPVIVTHLEDPPGSGLAACSGHPFRAPNGFSEVPRWLCSGCARAPLRLPAGLDVARLELALAAVSDAACRSGRTRLWYQGGVEALAKAIAREYARLPADTEGK